MKGLFKKVLAGILVFTMLCPMMTIATPVKAAEAKELEWGFKYESNSWNNEYYKFELDKKTLVHIEFITAKGNKLYQLELLALQG